MAAKKRKVAAKKSRKKPTSVRRKAPKKEAVEIKRTSAPDEMRTFDKGKVEVANVGTASIGKITLEPGWSWSACVKPVVKTESCQMPHTQYAISGHLKVKMDDGSEFEVGPGDSAYVPPGHDAWVVGDEPFVAVDFTGMKEYAKK